MQDEELKNWSQWGSNFWREIGKKKKKKKQPIVPKEVITYHIFHFSSSQLMMDHTNASRVRGPRGWARLLIN